jgi:hypothetical protein
MKLDPAPFGFKAEVTCGFGVDKGADADHLLRAVLNGIEGAGATRGQVQLTAMARGHHLRMPHAGRCEEKRWGEQREKRARPKFDSRFLNFPESETMKKTH